MSPYYKHLHLLCFIASECTIKFKNGWKTCYYQRCALQVQVWLQHNALQLPSSRPRLFPSLHRVQRRMCKYVGKLGWEHGLNFYCCCHRVKSVSVMAYLLFYIAYWAFPSTSVSWVVVLGTYSLLIDFNISDFSVNSGFLWKIDSLSL